MEIKCVNIPGKPTQEVYVCVQEVDEYKRIIPLYKIVEPNKLIKLDILLRDHRIKGKEWLDVLELSEEELLSRYFSTPEGKAELLFGELIDSELIPKPKNGYITINKGNKTYKIEIETLKLYINGEERCFQCKEDIPHFDKLIALCLTILHNPEKLEVR